MSMRYQAGFLTASYFPLKVPDAPTIGTATAGNAQVSVTFTAPSNVGGGAITSYIAVAKDSSSGAVFTNTGASSPIVVTGLTNGNTYTVTVAATNAFGTGPLSAASNSVTPSVPVVTSTVDYLVVAGGGGGGANRAAGGGGAGGFRTATSFAVSAGSAITVTVGAGGAAGGGPAPYTSQTNGSNSVFSSITSTGGGFGAGGQFVGPSAGNGGSGGGAGSNLGGFTSGTGIAGQGFNGGECFDASSPEGGGGGGGASAVGVTGTAGQGGAGGAGTASSYSGSSVTYAGGGGGAAGQSGTGTGGAGGAGGGGAGTSGAVNAGNGTANTGGGGGGLGLPNTTSLAGAGGSGVVIIRYSDAFPLASATTGSPTITTTGGFRIYRWTSSGSITF